MKAALPDAEREGLDGSQGVHVPDPQAMLEALRASEEFKTRLIESSRDCIKVLDLEGRLLSMNAGGMEVLEICDLGPFLNTSWVDFWQGEDREQARVAVAAARAGQVGRFVGYFATRQTATPLWFDVVVNAIRDADGKPYRLLALSRDVTELKRAEDALRRAHEELERKVEERTAELARANAALQREISERRQLEATRRAVVEGVEAETGDRFFPSLVRHLAAALGVQYAFVSELSEDRLRFRTLAVWGRGAFLPNFEVPLKGTPCEAVLNGEMAHHPARLQALFPEDTALADWQAESYCGVPLSDLSGGVVGHLAIIHDQPLPDGARSLSIMRIFAARARAEIERLRAETALRESQERLARILDSAMDAIVTFDGARRIQIFNDAAERIFRCPAEEAMGQSFDRFLNDASREALDRSLQVLRNDGQARPYVWAPDGLLARRSDGQEFPVEATLSHVEVGGRRLYTLILRDVDERRQAEAELRQLSLQNEYLQEEIRSVHNVDEIVGQSRALGSALEKVRLVAETDSSVLILGETGTGKELIARSIHSRSRRRDRPLIKVNCAALPTGLIESELFGHERGAFTGAAERRIGRFELADGGTIFLDEIGEVPPEVQVKLLRVLQEHEFERIGGSKTIRVDVRVIAATNRDLSKAVAEGNFRQDLYYRLNVFPVTLPPLRTRPEDVPLLVHYFVGRFAAKIGRQISRVPRAAMQRLIAYSWPGNVRELENVIERAVILSRGTELDVAPEMLMETHSVSSAATVEQRPRLVSGRDPRSLDEVERDHIVSVLKQTRWRIDGPQGAARRLNLPPSTLRSRIKKLGIQRSHEHTS
ncbi:MAG TPA: sigma 54-interacting transcriptional regulator [Candidatus Margulisiibacteriota bacterium]|nr:sigma 54-interacting transcriptional regulator [Candidatus Margulisiibacteriota bacterium]